MTPRTGVKLALITIALLAAFTFGAPLLTLFFGLDPHTVEPALRHASPSFAHPLGTDTLGRDVLARLAYGGRTSLTIAVVASIGSVGIGGVLGLAGGYFGGIFDRVLMRGAELLMALPRLPLMLLLLAIDRSGSGSGAGVTSGGDAEIDRTTFLIGVIVALSWPFTVRIARGAAIELRARPFVEAARALGASDTHILLRHILPHALTPLLVAATIEVGELILYESALSFLGIGIDPSAPSWGVMLSQGFGELYRAPSLMVYPGLLTVLSVGAFLILGDSFRDLLDPRSERG